MKILTKIALFTLVAALLIGSFGSCAAKISEEEALAHAKKLLTASVEVNEIYFGLGLPNGYGEYEINYGPLDEDKFGPTYADVTAESKYKTVDELKALAASVYSTDYCSYLFELAFTGFEGDDGSVVYPKYVVGADGILTVKISGLPIVEKTRTFDTDSIKITMIKPKVVTFTADSYVDGVKDETLTLTMVREVVGGNVIWRLDTPSY